VLGSRREGNGAKKRDGAAAGDFSSGSVAWGRGGKGGGGALRAQPRGDGGGGKRGAWDGGRQCGAAGNDPRPSGVGGGIAARTG
jgi:hypothetical protein